MHNNSRTKHVKIAGEYNASDNLTKVTTESEFAKAINELFVRIRPRKVIETGTYLGTGTTAVIASALQLLGITDATFYTIEVNTEHYRQAIANLAGKNYNVKAIKGLSVPRRLLPTLEEIEDSCVKNIEFDDIFIDHQEYERALLYYKETDFGNLPDDLLGECLKKFDYRPDFVLLDSAGHMGFIEFEYLLENLKGTCYIALDGTNHVKHHKSFRLIQQDPRFEIVISSKDKLGFCIARFVPAPQIAREEVKHICTDSIEDSVQDNKAVKNVLIVRPDAIGDFLIFSGVLEHFRVLYPDAKISILVQNIVAPLARACPHIDEVIPFDRKAVLRDTNKRDALLNALRAHAFDVAVYPLYSRECCWDQFTLNVGAKTTITIDGGYTNQPQHLQKANDLCYDILLPARKELMLETARNDEFIYNISGGKIVSNSMPLAWLSPANHDAAGDILRRLQIDDFIAICPFAQAAARQWPAYKWVQLLRHYHDYNILICGPGSDSDQANELMALSNHPRMFNCCGKTSILDMAALIKRARLCITMESAPAHLAAAVDIPHVVVVGGGHFGRFMPYSPQTHIVARKMSCFNCDWRCEGWFWSTDCITLVEVADVKDTVDKILGIRSAAADTVVSSALQPAVSHCWCGGDLTSSVHPAYGRCTQCGTLVLLAPPAQDELRKFYTIDNYWRRYVTNISKYPPIEWRAVDDFRDRIPIWHSILTENKADINSMLEIGCAHGGFLHYCRGRGIHNVVGVEVDEKTCQFARSYFNLPNVVAGGWPDAVLPFEKFDAITGFDVIEHFPDPIKGLARIAQCLNPDGIFLFQVPCYNNQDANYKHFRSSEHIYLFNEESLRQIFFKAGLVITTFMPGCYEGDCFVIGRLRTADMASCPLPQKRDLSPEFDLEALTIAAQTAPPKQYKYLVSAIVSTYNSEKYFRGCIEDLERQTIADKIEIIVVNSNSPTDEDSIIKELQQKYSNIQYIRTPRRETLYKAWNRAIKLASGKYITNANTDDRHRPDALEILANALEANPDKAVAYSDQRIVDKVDGKQTSLFIAGKFSRYRLMRNWCFISSQQMWRKSLHDEFGYFDPQCFISGDYEFWLRVSQRHEFLYIKEILGNRVLTDECLSMSEHHTKDSRSFLEDRIIRLAYRYAWENSIIIDRRGISANPLFKNWHDVKLWKRRIRAKIKNKPFTVTQSVKSISDSHQQLAPALSIVIPAKCDSENLRACLASLGSQTNSDFELVLIDRSGSIAALAPENGSLNYPLRYVSLREDWGQPAARNIGIHFARGRFVAFIDERCTLHPEFVGNTITHFSNDNILGLRGKILPPPAFRGYSPKHFDLGDNPLLSTCEEGSCVFRRDALLKLDGFDITLVGFDIPEICYRLYKSDDKNIYAVVYYPDVVTYQDCCVDVDAYHRRDFKMYVGRKYAITKDAKMQNYLDFFQNFNPANRKLVESDFNKLMSIALMLKGPYPADAIEWATKAFALKPGDIRCHYILGELYVKVNNYTRATDLLESMVEPLLAMLDYGYSTLAGYNPDQLKNPAVCFTAVFNNLKNTSEYFASVATMLAQCYVSQKAFGKIKTIYLCLLQNKAIVLTDQLNNDFTSVLAKLHNIEPEPIEPKTKIAFTKPTASTRQPMRPDVSTSELQHDYVEIITIAVFLQKYYPELALKWAQKAVAVDPNRIKGRYLLGSLYFGMESYDKAADMLEPIFLTQMQNLGNPAVSALEFEHQTANVDCCLSVGTMLAQCYMKEGQYGKLKMVYTLLLNSPYLAMPPEQRASIHALLGKLQNVEDVPVQAATPQIDSPVHYPLKPEPCVNAADERGEKYLVSAIVSTYNSETFIRGCLEDLESQTIADRLEIIVVNSGSEQNEESIVKEFQEKYGNIVYIKTEREGLYSAWNRAIKAASGQFLTNANTDDRHRRDAFEVMANTLLKNTDVVLVYGNQIITDTPNPSFENHHVIEMAKRPEFSRQRLLFGCCVGSQPMWRKSLHDEFGGFDETLVCAADWDFWLKIAQKHNFKHIDEFMGLFYRNENGIEHGRKIHSLYERYAVGKRYGNPYISVIQQYNAPGNPLVSIIVTAYNAADYISRAIESILIQSYRNFEIIVVDDGSTDNTAEIVRGFKNEPIKYFFKGNGGVASARNFGLQKSGGSFIIMLDSDDMMTPDYIASHLQGFEQHPEADMVYCDDLLIDEQDKPIRIINRPEYSNPDGIISDMFRCGFPVVHFKTCIRRSVFDKLGLYDERLIVAEDYDMMRRFIKQQLKMRHLPAALYLRRLRADSLSKDFNAVKAKSHFDVIRRFTETFTPEQLFPDVQWDALPAGQKTMLAKCKEALAYLGIGEQYINSKAPDYAEAAFEMACAEMDDCCKIEPGNQQVRNLREKCQFIRDKRVSNAGKDIYQQV